MDQRGVKAHADRAIFILTTNAGDLYWDVAAASSGAGAFTTLRDPQSRGNADSADRTDSRGKEWQNHLAAE
jgi:hypothetical protein